MSIILIGSVRRTVFSLKIVSSVSSTCSENLQDVSERSINVSERTKCSYTSRYEVSMATL